MGKDVANVKIRSHAQPSGAITADRWMGFHLADDSISESLTNPAPWDDLANAVRTVNATAFDNVIDDLKALVSFTWDQDWTDATHKAFKDVIWP